MKKLLSVLLALAFVLSMALTSVTFAFGNGDVNKDGSTDNKDVVILFRFVSRLQGSEDNSEYDFNKDGYVNNKDVVDIFRFVSSNDASSEEETDATSDEYFDFRLRENGTYAISVKYKDDDAHIDIPDEIVIPSKHDGTAVTALDTYSFGDCGNLKSVTIPDSVTVIGNYAFYGCSSLSSINLPDSLQAMGAYVFYGCSSLTDMTVPDGVTTIYSGAFSDCSNLTSVIMPAVTSLGYDAFSGCGNLTSVIMPAVTSVEYDSFSGCSIQRIEIGKLIESTSLREIIGNTNNIKEVIISDGVTSLCNFALGSCGELTSVVIPDGLEIIGSSAFSGCGNLTSITIPESVTQIKAAFYGCDKLVYNEYDNALYLGNENNPYHALIKAKDKNIQSVKINDITAVIAGVAFADCSSLTSVKVPDSVTVIGQSTFSGCSSLTGIDLPDGLTSIGYGAFSSCSSLTGIDLPDGLTSIDSQAFKYCYNLADITIPDNVLSLGSEVFSGCGGITSIIIPAGVTELSRGFLRGCYNLESITVSDDNKVYYSSGNCIIEKESRKLITGCKNCVIPDDGSITSIPDGAFDETNITSLIIPDSVVSIGDSAFLNCHNLTSVTFGSGVTDIENQAFACCGLTELTLGENVTSIGAMAFMGNSNLKSITIPKSLKYIPERAFFDCGRLTDVRYDGTKAQWDEITSPMFPAFNKSSYTVHCTDGDFEMHGSEIYY